MSAAILFAIKHWRWLAGAAVLALALLFVHAYGQSKYKAGQAQVQAKWDAARLAANKALIKKEREDVERYQQAITQRETALAAARTAAGKSAAAAASLRGQLDTARSRLAEADAATCADYATTASAVFSECVTRYRCVAEAADGHAADAGALIGAWPK